MFRAVATLNKQTYENPKNFDSEMKFVTETNKIQEIILTYFTDKLMRKKNKDNAQQFEGEP